MKQKQTYNAIRTELNDGFTHLKNMIAELSLCNFDPQRQPLVQSPSASEILTENHHSPITSKTPSPSPEPPDFSKSVLIFVNNTASESLDLYPSVQEIESIDHQVHESAKNPDSLIEPLERDSIFNVQVSVHDVLLVNKVDSPVKEVERLDQYSISGNDKKVAHQVFDQLLLRVTSKEKQKKCLKAWQFKFKRKKLTGVMLRIEQYNVRERRSKTRNSFSSNTYVDSMKTKITWQHWRMAEQKRLSQFQLRYDTISYIDVVLPILLRNETEEKQYTGLRLSQRVWKPGVFLSVNARGKEQRFEFVDEEFSGYEKSRQYGNEKLQFRIDSGCLDITEVAMESSKKDITELEAHHTLVEAQQGFKIEMYFGFGLEACIWLKFYGCDREYKKQIKHMWHRWKNKAENVHVVSEFKQKGLVYDAENKELRNVEANAMKGKNKFFGDGRIILALTKEENYFKYSRAYEENSAIFVMQSMPVQINLVQNQDGVVKKLRSSLLQSISGLEFCVDNIVIIKIPIKATYSILMIAEILDKDQLRDIGGRNIKCKMRMRQNSGDMRQFIFGDKKDQMRLKGKCKQPRMMRQSHMSWLLSKIKKMEVLRRIKQLKGSRKMKLSKNWWFKYKLVNSVWRQQSDKFIYGAVRWAKFKRILRNRSSETVETTKVKQNLENYQGISLLELLKSHEARVDMVMVPNNSTRVVKFTMEQSEKPLVTIFSYGILHSPRPPELSCCKEDEESLVIGTEILRTSNPVKRNGKSFVMMLFTIAGSLVLLSDPHTLFSTKKGT